MECRVKRPAAEAPHVGRRAELFTGLLSLCAAACADVPAADEPRGYDAAITALRGRSAEALPMGGALQVSLPAAGRREYVLELSASAHVALHAAPDQPRARVTVAVERSGVPEPRRVGSVRGEPGRPADLSLSLGPGRYRVSVRLAGGEPSWITLSSGCTGAGCPDDVLCVFGDHFAERDALPQLELVDELRFHSAGELGPDLVTAHQIVAALHSSSHGDVTSVQQAFAAADAGELRRVRFVARAGDERYVAWEYGAGDNSYGAYFAEGSSRVLAAIHDGDVVDCARFAR